MMEHLSTLFYRLLMHSSICILEAFYLFKIQLELIIHLHSNLCMHAQALCSTHALADCLISYSHIFI